VVEPVSSIPHVTGFGGAPQLRTSSCPGTLWFRSSILDWLATSNYSVVSLLSTLANSLTFVLIGKIVAIAPSAPVSKLLTATCSSVKVPTCKGSPAVTRPEELFLAS